MSAETPTNILIMNPYFSLKWEELDVRLHEKSFQEAMDFARKNRERVRDIFLMVDTPLFTSRAHGIFRAKAEARGKKGKYWLRHLGQFHPTIVDWYRTMMDWFEPEEIQVLTESRAQQEVVNLPDELRDKMAKCEADGSVSCVINRVSCRAITCMGMNLSLTAGGVNQLEFFFQKEPGRTDFITMLDAGEDLVRVFGHRHEQININHCK